MLKNDVYAQIDEITQRVLNGGEMSAAEGVWMMNIEDDYVPWLMAGADRLRKTYRGNEIEVCAISNVRSGNCSEDCSFCSQSGHHKTEAPVYNYIAEDTLLEQAEKARSWGASDIGIVSKGWGVRSDKERNQLKSYLGTLKDKSDIGRCASLGVLDKDTAVMLKESGLENYHHNLECAESFFGEVCTTHTYQENIDTIKNAAEAGLRVCAGGILGMGETIEQRIELADTLRKIGVESVPMNFLNPAEGTPFGGRETMKPMEILRSIATFRYMLPKAEIRIAGGRSFLGDMQSMIFMAGASGVMIGDYLTTQGRSVNDDLNMIDALRLDVRGDTQQRRENIKAEPIRFVG
ncbi:MAG: biotin synthase BioB [Gammaproteobacteria bacterium]|nr:biotin synthase BioB [Gammaproteobacteria bacterium]